MKKLAIQIIGALLVVALVGLTSCEKKEILEPIVEEVFTVYDLSGHWVKSSGSMNLDEIDIVHTHDKFTIYQMSPLHSFLNMEWRITGLTMRPSSASYTGKIVNPREIILYFKSNNLANKSVTMVR